mgnify:CR=1 FL=1|jgi:hypothetical protein
MAAPLIELEQVLEQLIVEHEKLLRHIDSQQAAMKKLDARALEASAQEQEAARLRITALEARRRAIIAQLSQTMRLGPKPTLAQVADASPAARARLLALRQRLKQAATAVSNRAQIASRVAGAVLGHLNTAVRLISGAVEQAGLYTRNGTPQSSARIGLLEAVG